MTTMGRIFKAMTSSTIPPEPYKIETWIRRVLTPNHETEGRDTALLRVKLRDALAEVNRLGLIVGEKKRAAQVGANHD
jgi:hypothetical protein